MASMTSVSVTVVMIMTMIMSMLMFINGEANTSFCSQPNIRPGSTLSPASSQSSWPSPSGYFEFGFYQERDGFAIGIWLVTSGQKTVVWTANRDDSPLPSDARLEFDLDGGGLVVRTNGGRVVIASAASTGSLLDSGNLILCGHDSVVVWESFRHPTDTILQGQALETEGYLVSSASDGYHSTGRFHLIMQGDGNLVLYPKDTGNLPSEAYWHANTCCSKKAQLYLNSTGVLSVVNASAANLDTVRVLYRNSSSSPSVVYSNSSGNITTIFRATLDVDGNFRVYSHLLGDVGSRNFSGVSGDQRVFVEWQALQNPCEAKGFCGLNSYCTLNDGKPDCVGVPGTERRSDSAPGCFRNYTRGRCLAGGREDETLYSVAKMENMRWGDISYEVITRFSRAEECGKSCLEDCDCDAATFENRGSSGGVTCKKQRFPLRYVMRDFTTDNAAFFKTGNGSKATTTMTVKPPKPLPRVLVDNDKDLTRRILGLALGFIMLSCTALAIAGFYVVKIRVLRYKKLRDDGSADNHGLTLRVFSYNDLKRATNGFREELGSGSFGAVYKGSLNKGRQLVAVKRLEKVIEEGEREFRAEMRAIGRTNHKNLVRLLGYCAEGSKRLLVYEYMSNGSLAGLIFQDAQRMHWSERARIALEVARGILYLHEECRAPTIHCDIKPQNILMDESWTAKISDFGLAKFLLPDQTRTFTVMRGTKGYLAPEWHRINMPISVKADVYSYGIMLLEIVCGRKNLDLGAVNTEELVLSAWAYNCFVGGELSRLVAGQEFDTKTLDNMVKVGLWCIQDQPTLRPSMKSVVLMLEGITDVAIPPCPTST